MDNIINSHILSFKKMLELPSPTVICARLPIVEKAIAEHRLHPVKINLQLAKTLFGKSETEITTNITNMVIGLLPKNKPVYLSDFEMLFDPRYKLDLIKLFCEISRHNRLFVEWPGKFSNDSLTYAEPEYDDFAKYKVSDYEIVCVV